MPAAFPILVRTGGDTYHVRLPIIFPLYTILLSLVMVGLLMIEIHLPRTSIVRNIAPRMQPVDLGTSPGVSHLRC